MPKKQTHSPEVRAEALRRLAAGETSTAIGADLGVHRTTIAAWASGGRGGQKRSGQEANDAAASASQKANGAREVEAFVGELFLCGPAAVVAAALARLSKGDA